MIKTLYYKQIRIRSFGYDDFSFGTVILDWINEDDWNKIIPPYEYNYCIDERYVKND